MKPTKPGYYWIRKPGPIVSAKKDSDLFDSNPQIVEILAGSPEFFSVNFFGKDALQSLSTIDDDWEWSDPIEPPDELIEPPPLTLEESIAVLGPMTCPHPACVAFREKDPEFAQRMQNARIIAHRSGDGWFLSGITPVNRRDLEAICDVNEAFQKAERLKTAKQ
jgi:hypothetical protein